MTASAEEHAFASLRAPLVHESMAVAAAEHREDVAVRDETAVWTYGDLERFSRSVCAWLRLRGIKRGDRVMVCLPNSCAAVGLLYGIIRHGAVFVPVSPEARPYQLAGLVEDCEPALIVIERPGTFSVANPQITVDDLIAALPAPLSPADADRAQADDVALLMYTSGSTSRPKAVVCRHEQVAFAVAAIADRLAYRHDDVVYCRSPFSFDYGLYQVFLCAQAGAALAVTGRQPEPAVLKFAVAYGATVLPLVPSLAVLMIKLAGRRGGLPPVRLITNTGAELTAGTAEELRSVFPGAAIVFMYGMTECKRITIGDPDENPLARGSVGRALPGTHIDIVSDAGTLQPPGEVGQIVVRGRHLMDGYWRAPEATAERYRPHPLTGERALFTGDFGALDARGRLTFHGRNDDIFKRRGTRTSTAEIEAAALDIPGVTQAATITPDSDGTLHIWVVSEHSAAEVLRGLSERLEAAKVPDHCWVRDQLPQTPHGKVDKRQLRQAERDVLTRLRVAEPVGVTKPAGKTGSTT